MLFPLLLLLGGCAPSTTIEAGDSKGDSGPAGETGATDADGDGSADDEDCDDADAAVYPGAPERCNGLDDDCDRQADEGAEPVTWFRDADGDGFGTDSGTVESCEAPEGYAATAGDCDDTSPSISPAAQEVCSGVDDDCDGLVDQDDPSMSGFATWYRDADGDGYGAESSSVTACEAPDGYARDATDCDDTDPSAWPGAPESCDAIDDDCDGAVDEDAVDGSAWYADADGDGYGAGDVVDEGCTPPPGHASDDADCDDAEAAVNPGAPETCGDGLDNDCDGTANGCGLSGTASLSTADVTLTGVDVSDHAGFRLASGDVSGDGVDDLGTSGLAYSDSRGRVWVSFGPLSASGSLSAADVRLTSSDSAANAGYGLAMLDADGDGVDDLVVGATNYASDRGRAWLLQGPLDGSETLPTADAVIDGDDPVDQLGTMAALPDVDGDGTEDLALGAMSDSTGASYAGAAYVFAGAPTGSVDAADAAYRFVGDGSGDYAGLAVGSAGDLDADGLSDLVVGAPYNDAGAADAGVAYVLLEVPTASDDLALADLVLVGAGADSRAGFSVAGGGDPDDDGYDDILVGAPADDGAGTDAGAAYLVGGGSSGTVDLSAAAAEFAGSAAGDWAGYSCSLGDMDGDGVTDVVIGAWTADSAGTDSGSAYLLYGPQSGSVKLSKADVILTGSAAQDYAGNAVHTAGDLNDDGATDLVVGARGHEGGASDGGAAHVFFASGL